MTEKKKRGLLSWLGFGEEEQSPKTQNEANVENVEEQTEVESQVEAEVAKPTETQSVESELAESDQALEETQEEQQPVQAEAEAEAEAEQEEVVVVPQAKIEEVQEKPTESFFARLKRSLSRTKANIGAGFFGLFKGKQIDDDLFEELEEQLLIADVGMNTTVKIIENLTEKASRNDLKDGEALYGLLKEEMAEILSQVEQPLVVDTTKTPYVILMVGVNGVGKTTTIGKLAKQFQGEGKKVMLAAGDTFRAAAVEQLQVWGQRNDVPVIAQHTGADSASVIYDAIEAAKARGVDVVIADTAGRLQNKSNLMEELRKIVRVMKKIDDSAPHEIMLTLDAGTGQNAISQAKLFSEVAPVTGITLTKLDGTAKGGVIFSIADQFQIPIRYIGVGEGIDDLRPFESKDFIEALFSREE
ncbi:signal recognition particle-docking protein FtsY [Vibrio lentus]|uniref:signal recognition particle-docking protein FtsY n=1 Tax=Vibrio lentus TaxID=136468 RepID=UPI000C864EC2|nr:signal recognition particle-docking protein FtsY [Vibrio lentus]PMG95529.1 signal recognition particle-docking protein FtsY [Vibrio lentus]